MGTSLKSKVSNRILLSLVTSITIIGAAFFLFGSASKDQLPQSNTRIIFDSNRSGSFGIYSVATDGSDLQTIADTKDDESIPAVSPDNSTILYARREKSASAAQSDLWMVDPDGQNARLFVKNADFPSFSSDGKTVYFQRERKRIMAVDIDGNNEREIFPLGLAPFAGRTIVHPRVSHDGSHLAFVTDYPNKWKLWIYNFTTKLTYQIGHGCEPLWRNDGKALLWIYKGNSKSKSGIYEFSLETLKNKTVQDGGEPFGHEYFPHLSSDEKTLLWAACPADQHSHQDSNYQLFSRPLDSDEVTRVTNDPYTNRWPKLLKRKN